MTKNEFHYGLCTKMEIVKQKTLLESNMLIKTLKFRYKTKIVTNFKLSQTLLRAIINNIFLTQKINQDYCIFKLIYLKNFKKLNKTHSFQCFMFCYLCGKITYVFQTFLLIQMNTKSLVLIQKHCLFSILIILSIEKE